MCGRLEILARTEGGQHQEKRRRCTRHHRHDQHLSQLIAIHGLQVGAEDVDELIRVHASLSLRICDANAFSPRCTATFTADSDMPQRVAVSLTLSPSSFTY